MSDQPKLTGKDNFLQLVKYCIVAASAGLVQIGVFSLCSYLIFHDNDADYGPSYFIALVASVLWNFTFNRKYTFQSASNIPRAMLMVFGFYLVFTPLSVWWGVAITGHYLRADHPNMDLVKFLVLFGTMFVNGVGDFVFQRFVVFRKTINTNELAMKKRRKDET